MVQWLKPQRLLVYPSAICGLSALAWGLSFIVRPRLTGGTPYTIIGGDFLAGYTGGRFFLDGRLSELYNFQSQQAFMAALLAPAAAPRLPPFVHPPFDLILYAPFAALPYPAALLTWLAAGLVALVAAVALFRRDMFPEPKPAVGRLLLVSFLFYPTLAWFLFGQTTAFSLLLYTGFFLLLRRKRDLAAGLLLGLHFYKPHLAVGLAVMLLVQRRWRALAGTALAAAAWLAVGLAISPSAMASYLRLSPALIEIQRPAMWGEQNLFFFGWLLLEAAWPAGGRLLATALMAGGLVIIARWWWGRAWHPGSREWDFRLAATVVMGLLASLHLYWYELMLLLLPLGIAWARYYPRRGSRPLDSGPLLAWTAPMYILAWLGSYLTFAQQRLTEALGLPPMAIILAVPIMAMWSWRLWAEAGRPLLPEPQPELGSASSLARDGASVMAQ